MKTDMLCRLEHIVSASV